MISDHWEDVFAVFDAALSTSGVERDEFLARKCGDNARLRDKVESLLAAHRDAEGFLSGGRVAPLGPPAARRHPSPGFWRRERASACSRLRASPVLAVWAKSIEPAIRGSTVTSR